MNHISWSYQSYFKLAFKYKIYYKNNISIIDRLPMLWMKSIRWAVYSMDGEYKYNTRKQSNVTPKKKNTGTKGHNYYKGLSPLRLYLLSALPQVESSGLTLLDAVVGPLKVIGTGLS